ncbi:hypothetical protein [Laceyella sacchari]|uniref:hypothetical protein n=1 Tax=Laceyella sacchari TaxID=37482 RepID=UPI001042DCB8|nr:hypothetical protein [Laceyella sacchari]
MEVFRMLLEAIYEGHFFAFFPWIPSPRKLPHLTAANIKRVYESRLAHRDDFYFKMDPGNRTYSV